jgi:hypothetical protein
VFRQGQRWFAYGTSVCLRMGLSVHAKLRGAPQNTEGFEERQGFAPLGPTVLDIVHHRQHHRHSITDLACDCFPLSSFVLRRGTGGDAPERRQSRGGTLCCAETPLAVEEDRTKDVVLAQTNCTLTIHKVPGSFHRMAWAQLLQAETATRVSSLVQAPTLTHRRILVRETD